MSADNIDFMRTVLHESFVVIKQAVGMAQLCKQYSQPLPYLSAHETPDPNPASYANTTALQVGMDLGLSSCPSCDSLPRRYTNGTPLSFHSGPLSSGHGPTASYLS